MERAVDVTMPDMDKEDAEYFIEMANYGLSFLNYMELNPTKFSQIFPLMERMKGAAAGLDMSTDELKEQFDRHNARSLISISFIMKHILDQVASKYGIDYNADFSIEDKLMDRDIQQAVSDVDINSAMAEIDQILKQKEN
jgi:hypothetical protein